MMPEEPMDFGAFYRGFRAQKRAGWGPVVCPFPPGELVRAWLAGWRVAASGMPASAVLD